MTPDLTPAEIADFRKMRAEWKRYGIKKGVVQGGGVTISEEIDGQKIGLAAGAAGGADLETVNSDGTEQLLTTGRIVADKTEGLEFDTTSTTSTTLKTRDVDGNTQTIGVVNSSPQWLGAAGGGRASKGVPGRLVKSSTGLANESCFDSPPIIDPFTGATIFDGDYSAAETIESLNTTVAPGATSAVSNVLVVDAVLRSTGGAYNQGTAFTRVVPDPTSGYALGGPIASASAYHAGYYFGDFWARLPNAVPIATRLTVNPTHGHTFCVFGPNFPSYSISVGNGQIYRQGLWHTLQPGEVGQFSGGILTAVVPPTSPPPPPVSPPVVPPTPVVPPVVPPPPIIPPPPPPPPVLPPGIIPGELRTDAAPPSPPPPIAIGYQAVAARTDLHFWKVFGRLIRFSPNGTAWNITVSDAGTITATSLSVTPGEV